MAFSEILWNLHTSWNCSTVAIFATSPSCMCLRGEESRRGAVTSVAQPCNACRSVFCLLTRRAHEVEKSSLEVLFDDTVAEHSAVSNSQLFLALISHQHAPSRQHMLTSIPYLALQHALALQSIDRRVEPGRNVLTCELLSGLPAHMGPSAPGCRWRPRAVPCLVPDGVCATRFSSGRSIPRNFRCIPLGNCCASRTVLAILLNPRRQRISSPSTVKPTSGPAHSPAPHDQAPHALISLRCILTRATPSLDKSIQRSQVPHA